MALNFVRRNKEKYSPLAFDELSKLDGLTDKVEMIEKLSGMLELPVEEYKERETVTAEIHALLKKYYPNCLFVMFGSSVTGFTVRNCDLDLLFLPYPEYCSTEESKSDPTQPSDKTPDPDPESILSGETPRDVLYKLSHWPQFRFLKAVLEREKSIVKRVTMIPGKNSTIKIHLANSKIICDVHISNKMVIFNSELLQFLEKMDHRIKPLVLTLCFWARKLGFMKRIIFSNYAFTLLVIFYLQNTSPPILPPVQFLIDRAQFSRISAGWQTAFSTDMRYVKKSKNNKTLSELLVGFFEFYWNFDFVQSIVSPNSGKSLPTKAIKESTVEKMKEFEISSLNIQDPFMLSKNVCKIEEAPCIMFKFALHMAQQMLQKIPEKYKFRQLFDPAEYQNVYDFHFSKYVIGRPRIIFVNLDYDCMTHLNKTSKFSPQLWYERVSQAVYEALQYGLLIECEVTDKVNWGKTYGNENGWKVKKMEVDNENKTGTEITLPTPELLQSVQCVVYSRTWMGRKKFAEITVQVDDAEDFNNNPALKAEHSVSRELIRKNPVLNRSVPLMCFKCDCFKHTCPQVNSVIIMLKPFTFSREFYQVAGFLASYIPRTVKKIILAN